MLVRCSWQNSAGSPLLGNETVSYAEKFAMIHSSSSNPKTSLVLVEANCENMASRRSSWLLLAISAAPRAIIDDSRRTRAGTLPLDVQSSGLNNGGMRD